MTIQPITIYLGQWDGQTFVYSLKKEDAKLRVEASFRFGDPSEFPDALGNIWEGDAGRGWQIVAQQVLATFISVEIKVSGIEDTNHVVWQCPYCERFNSDDWESGDSLPMLFGCGCQEASKFLLGAMTTAHG